MTANKIPSLGALGLVAVMLVGSLGIPAVAGAQSSPPLAEVARKEAERRKSVTESKKVLTNKDLPESAIKPKGAPSAEPGQAGAAPGTEGAAAEGQPATAAAAEGSAAAGGDEAAWRSRISQAREALRRNEMFAQALQTRINSLTNDFASRDDPYQRARLGEERSKTIDELAAVKNDIEQSRKQIADIEEEARKAGIPPGWIR
jgi:hypothetical protein